jgi:hypothetical protein
VIRTKRIYDAPFLAGNLPYNNAVALKEYLEKKTEENDETSVG